MPVPKKRTSHSRRNMRRAHSALAQCYPNVCPKCAEPVLRHHVCMNCGTYRGKQMITGKSETPADSENAQAS